MIAFNDGADSGDVPQEPISLQNYMELLKAVLGTDPFPPGSYHSGLSPAELGQLLGNIMYTGGYGAVHFIIERESNGHHLALTIDKKEK